MGHQRKTNPSFLATPIANRIGIRDERSASGRSIDPLAQRFVITLCDYGTCPNIKSKNAIKTMIVVKYDGNYNSIETQTNHIVRYHNDSFNIHNSGVQMICEPK